MVIQAQSGLYEIELNDNLSNEEVEMAERIINWLTINGQFYGIAGHMIVTGMPRQGKGLFANTFAWWIKHLFKDIRILMDVAPKPVFGNFTLFNEDVLYEEMTKMTELSEGGNGKKPKMTNQDVDRWRNEYGTVMMKKSVCVLDEYWKMMYNRRPGTAINYYWSGVIRQWGHIDTLIIGIAQMAHDLDAYTCLPYVNYDVRCVWSTERTNTVEAKLHKVMYNKGRRMLIPVGKPIPIYIDGGKQRPELGIKCIEYGEPVYYSYFDLYYSKSPPQFKFGKMKMAKDNDNGTVE